MKNLVLVLALTALSFGATAKNFGVSNKESKLNFGIQKFAIGKVVDGKFKTFSGSASIDDGTIRNLVGKVVVGSIDTGSEKRDNHLKSGDFFAVNSYPTMTFKTDGALMYKPGQESKVNGKLTIKGKTKAIKLKLKVIQGKKGRYILIGKSTINRYDFGISWNKRQDKKETSIFDSIADFAKGLGDQYVIDKNVDIDFRLVLLPKA